MAYMEMSPKACLMLTHFFPTWYLKKIFFFSFQWVRLTSKPWPSFTPQIRSISSVCRALHVWMLKSWASAVFSAGDFSLQ